ncbi:uncharacterized protein RCO7_06278 [Rhynchosporium graminicola]|uniref:Uncharacterized protein n=1 Tax=Rhynchosporium graminicola TaxID=2792576 RepID=A0A1E1KWA8_9HELO|nr:uncharacterized protein RCO7_06278 [Rhynchosporium commune]
MSSRPPSNNEELNSSTINIQHITHDKSLSSLPVVHKRLSASMKVRSFISRRISKNLDSPYPNSHHERETEDRPTTSFPRFEARFDESKSSLAESKSEMTGDLVQDHKRNKETKKQEKVLISANSSGSYLPLQSPTEEISSINPSTKLKGKETAHFPSMPSLKKSTFSNLVKRKPVPEVNVSRNSEEKADGMAKIHNLRKAMQEGKLERVVPPPSANISSGQNRRPPPRPPHSPFLDYISSTGSPSLSASSQQISKLRTTPQTLSPRASSQSARPTARTKKTDSAGSKIVSLIGTSADFLDETRREIKGEFRPPFDYLNYPSFSLGKKAVREDDGDDDSDESFFCFGDEEPGILGSGLGTATLVKSEDFRPKTRGKGSERGGSRDRGPGRGYEDEFTAVLVVKKCKLCGLGIVASSRGLCGECETDILSLKRNPLATEMESTCSDSEYEDDLVRDNDNDSEEDVIPVTLPLNIRKQATIVQEPLKYTQDISRPTNPFEFHDSNSEEEESERPPVPPKDIVILGLSFPNRSYRPVIQPIDQTRQNSQRAEIEKQPETQTAINSFRSASWQSNGASPTYEEARKMLERWSDCFGDGAVEGMRDNMVDDDGVPMVRALDCDGVKRDSEFYRFWDEVLKEHAPKTPAEKTRIST